MVSPLPSWKGWSISGAHMSNFPIWWQPSTNFDVQLMGSSETWPQMEPAGSWVVEHAQVPGTFSVKNLPTDSQDDVLHLAWHPDAAKSNAHGGGWPCNKVAGGWPTWQPGLLDQWSPDALRPLWICTSLEIHPPAGCRKYRSPQICVRRINLRPLM